MTKILATDTMGKKIVFGSFSECATYFQLMPSKIKTGIDKGCLVKTDRGAWFFDYALEDM